jgi:hypothetical protein
MLMSQATQAMFLVATHSEDTSAVKTSLFTWFCSLSRVHIHPSLPPFKKQSQGLMTTLSGHLTSATTPLAMPTV